MITAIVAAAGSGSRMGKGINKVFLALRGEPILTHSLKLFNEMLEIEEVIVVTAEADIPAVERLVSLLSPNKPFKVVAGGSERQISITNALKAVSYDSQIVVVHDGARPMVSAKTVRQVIDEARAHKAAGVAVRVKDTIKITNAQGFAVETPDRSTLWAIQTPQAFSADLLRRAYEMADQNGFLGTDDASLVERIGVPVKLVTGDYGNIKITTPEDLLIADALAGRGTDMLRVGVGYDVHKLIEGRQLVLGGVNIPHTHGLDGHSDADVLLHSIKDALLGAAALGDIGRHFPDNDERYKGISSVLLLARVREILAEKGFSVNNVDATIVAEKPKLAPYIEEMNRAIAQTLHIGADQVNVKATTTEGLGFAGKREGIAAYSVATIIKHG